MKKLMYLQMYADDAQGAAAATAATEATETAAETAAETEEKKTAQAATEKAEDVPKYTDKDVDKLINQKFAEWQKKQDKAVDEAKKLSAMNAQQKAEYERDKIQKELDEYKRRDALAEMAKSARKMLSDGGITVNDDLLGLMVTTDAAQTKAAIDGFSEAFKQAVEAAVKERLKGEPPRKGTGGVPTMTKEQIKAIRDPELRQKKMLEHRDLFGF